MVKIPISKNVFILIKNGLPCKVDMNFIPEKVSFIQNGKFVECDF